MKKIISIISVFLLAGMSYITYDKFYSMSTTVEETKGEEVEEFPFDVKKYKMDVKACEMKYLYYITMHHVYEDSIYFLTFDLQNEIFKYDLKTNTCEKVVDIKDKNTLMLVGHDNKLYWVVADLNYHLDKSWQIKEYDLLTKKEKIIKEGNGQEWFSAPLLTEYNGVLTWTEYPIINGERVSKAITYDTTTKEEKLIATETLKGKEKDQEGIVFAEIKGSEAGFIIKQEHFTKESEGREKVSFVLHDKDGKNVDIPSPSFKTYDVGIYNNLLVHGAKGKVEVYNQSTEDVAFTYEHGKEIYHSFDKIFIRDHFAFGDYNNKIIAINLKTGNGKELVTAETENVVNPHFWIINKQNAFVTWWPEEESIFHVQIIEPTYKK